MGLSEYRGHSLLNSVGIPNVLSVKERPKTILIGLRRRTFDGGRRGGMGDCKESW